MAELEFEQHPRVLVPSDITQGQPLAVVRAPCSGCLNAPECEMQASIFHEAEGSVPGILINVR